MSVVDLSLQSIIWKIFENNWVKREIISFIYTFYRNYPTEVCRSAEEVGGTGLGKNMIKLHRVESNAWFNK